MLQSGVTSSAMEHRILEQMTGVESVSTIKVLEIANQKGIPLYAITSETIDEILPKLSVDNSTKLEIKNSVNLGKTVIIPQSNIQINDWNGVGYIVLDTETFAAGYMISGGIAGGSMTTGQVLAEYVTYVISGLIFMILAEVVETLLMALLPGGWALAIIWGIRIILIVHYISYIVQLVQLYSVTGEPWILQEILIQISAMCTLGAIRMGPMKDFFAEIGSVKAAVTQMKATGASSGTCLNFIKTYGIGKVNQATQVMGNFFKYGFSDNQLSILGSNFTPKYITCIETTFAKIGVASSSEIDLIMIMFKQAGSVSGAETLSTSLITLSNRGIVPSNFSLYGITNAITANSVVSAISNGILPATIKALFKKGISSPQLPSLGIDSELKAQEYLERIENGDVNKDYKDILVDAGLTDDKISDILSKPKGTRPAAQTYLSDAYIQNHYEYFKKGASFLMSQETYDKYYDGKYEITRSDGTMFFGPKDIMDIAINVAAGDLSIVEQKLGYDTGSLSNGYYILVNI